MSGWLTRLLEILARNPKAASNLPWKKIIAAALWLEDRARNNLSERERDELLGLLRRSKGRRSNLTQKEQQRVFALIRQGVLGNEDGPKRLDPPR